MSNMPLRAIIIDDEQDSIDSIESIVNEFCINVEIVCKTTNPALGIREIIEKKPQLVFLDVEMPHMNGFELLKSIPNRNFEVIFVTAYNHYAIEAFKVTAIDYILKPINIVELVNAVNRVVQKFESQLSFNSNYQELFNKIDELQKRRITFTTRHGTEFVYPDEIVKVEASGSYSEIYFLGRNTIVVSKNLKELEELLDNKYFFRSHKSHLINVMQIKKYSLQLNSVIELNDGSKVVLSRRKKEEFLKKVSEALN